MSYKLRQGASDGLWLTCLLPFCLLPLCLNSKNSVNKLPLVVASTLPIYYICRRFILKKTHSAFESHYVFFALLSIPASFIITWFLPINFKDIVSTYLLCLVVIFSYNSLISKLLIHCPGSFTVGEVQMIAQGIVVFLVHSLMYFKEMDLHSHATNHTEAMDLLKLLLMGLALLVCALYIFPSLRNGLKIYCMSFGCAFLMIFVWTFLYERNVVQWFIDYCLYRKSRIYLLLFWFLLTTLSVLFVVWANQRPNYRATTLDRKYFHFIINAVFLSGIFYDMQFLCFASVVALGAFIVLEMYRLLQIPVIGSVIEEAFKIFLDEKDSGILILTHIYLLIGCSSSLWLSAHYIHKNRYHISLLSGVLSVGFGDTFAAIGGTLLGKHRWHGSKKTIEGTICAIVVQLILSFFFLCIGHDLSMYNVGLVILAVILTSLVEAKTTQVDNLVLPLFMFAFLSRIM